MIQKTIFFLHIPKTAGQSFRKAGLRYFGEANSILLYGEDAKTTTTIANKLFYKTNNTQQEKFDLLSKYMVDNDIKFFSSHASASVLSCFSTENTVIFLRNPIDRIISHYNYAISKKVFKGSFESFIEDKMYQNIQSSILCDLDLCSIGFIGLTEFYSESILLFNTQFNTSLKEYKENKASFFSRKVIKGKLDTKLLERIEFLNKKDFELYKNGKEIFFQRFHKYEARLV